MVFGRRKPRELWRGFVYSLWPQTGWKRAFRYFGKRVLRLSATPHAIALGFACGAFASFTPFIGLHFVVAALVAYVLRGNMLASAFGTIIGNPLTFPFIWGLTHQLGSNMLGLRSVTPPPDLEDVVEPSLTVLQSLWPGTLKPMLVGSIPLGLCCAIFTYVIVRGATAAYQKKRRDYLARKLAMQQAEQARRQDTSFEYSPTPNEPPA